MIRAAVIGSIGSGKTFVSKLFKCPVFNADDISKNYSLNNAKLLLKVSVVYLPVLFCFIVIDKIIF